MGWDRKKIERLVSSCCMVCELRTGRTKIDSMWRVYGFAYSFESRARGFGADR